MTKPRKGKKAADPEAAAFLPPQAIPVAQEPPEESRFTRWSRANMNSFEKKVWRFLGEDDGVWGFQPQVEKEGYILDFFSQKYLVCVEADGAAHMHSKESDDIRDERLLSKGILTVRLTPGDFVKYTPQQLFRLIEEAVHPKQVLKSGKEGVCND